MTLYNLHLYFIQNGIEHWGGDSEGKHTIYYDPNNQNKKLTMIKQTEGIIKREYIAHACDFFEIDYPFGLN